MIWQFMGFFWSIYPKISIKTLKKLKLYRNLKAEIYLECRGSGSTNPSSMKFHWPPKIDARSRTVTSATSAMDGAVRIPLGPYPITATFGLT